MSKQKSLIKETVQYYWHVLNAYKRDSAMSFFYTFTWFLSEDIIGPILLSAMVDALIEPGVDRNWAITLLWLMVANGVAHVVLGRLCFYHRNRLLANTEQDLYLRILEIFSRQSYSFYSNNFVGSLTAKANRFISTFKELFDTLLFPITGLIIQFVIPVFILLNRAPQIAYVFIVVGVLFAFVSVVVGRYKNKYLRANAAQESAVTGSLADNLANMLAVKVFAREESEYQRFSDVTSRKKATYKKSMNITEVVRSMRSFLSVVFELAIAISLFTLIDNDSISIGTILLAQIYLVKLGQSLWNLSKVSERLEETLANAAEMTEIIQLEPEVKDSKQAKKLKVKQGEIEFSNVSFQYKDGSGEENLFDGFNLKIKHGERVGLVGPSGGGKTTVTRLILRFMDIDNGKISIDSQDISKATQSDLRSHISYVPQEPLLFHRSVYENIAFGNPDATQEEVREVAKLAHANEFIEKLPQGYETLVGERGVKLSGGEKQRIAIARAMLKKAPILVLDEATSALDSKSEKAIVGVLDNLMKNRTTIVIAHRLSTIRKMDRIIVLKDGKVVEDGPHDKLLAAKGVYGELWTHQSGEFLSE